MLVGPSPRYIDDERLHRRLHAARTSTSLLESLDSNYLGWSSAMAPVIMGNPDRPELGEELTNSFCRTDPEIARHFARVTFLSDNRADLRAVRVPDAGAAVLATTSIAPAAVGEYVHSAIAGSTLVLLAATGHCPNLSAPEETVAAIAAFLARRRRDRRRSRDAADGARGLLEDERRGPVRERALRLPVRPARTARSSGSTRPS